MKEGRNKGSSLKKRRKTERVMEGRTVTQIMWIRIQLEIDQVVLLETFLVLFARIMKTCKSFSSVFEVQFCVVRQNRG